MAPSNGAEALLQKENRNLLQELETAYKTMEMIVEQSNREQKIAYDELQQKFNALEGLYREISNKENLLIHMEKLSSIGQFISEIIHELNNPLTGISGGAHLLKTLNPPENLKPFIKIIEENVKRMTGYLRRFREMVYKGEENFVLFDANQNLQDCLATIEIIKPKSIQLTIRTFEHPLMIKGDPYQVNQIYLNLAKNAFDALKAHGDRIDVSIRQVTKDWIQHSGGFSKTQCQDAIVWASILEEKNDFALVEFEDNANGIPADIIENIFQAFYTTKGRDKGTGLGLSISSDIARRHGGNLAVKSMVGTGTTFQILLPIAQKSS